MCFRAREFHMTNLASDWPKRSESSTQPEIATIPTPNDSIPIHGSHVELLAEVYMCDAQGLEEAICQGHELVPPFY